MKIDKTSNQYNWNLQDIYKDNKAWEADLEKVEKEYIPKVADYKNKLKDAESLLGCLKASETLERTLDKLFLYARMNLDIDNTSSLYTEMSAKVEALGTEASKAGAYIEPELLAKPEGTLRGFFGDSRLDEYRHFLDKLIKSKAHTLSQAEEEVVASLGELASAPEEFYTKITEADLKYPKIKDEKGKLVQLTDANYSLFLADRNREVRKRAFEGVMKTYKGMENAIAAAQGAEVKKNVVFARVYKYPSALDAALDSEDIPKAVYNNLIDSVNKNIGYLHRYINLKKRVLKLDKVNSWDMWVPLVDDYEMKISYDAAQNMLMEGLKPLGDDYTAVVQKAFQERWIDVYEKENKTGGAYQWGSYDTHPYLLLNYTDEVDEGLLTLAHEMGHAVHHYFTHQNQHYINSGMPPFTAEVSSTANEWLVLDYLIKNAKNNKEKLYLINKAIDNIRSTVYSQVLYAEFQKAIHERVEKGEALSAESLNQIWKGLLVKYYGPDFAITPLDTAGWMRVPHFYMGFYVYKYATAISASYPITQDIIKGDKGAVERYIEFLKAGDSDYPIELLRRAGVDMTSPKAVDDLLEEFGRMVGEMERLLGV